MVSENEIEEMLVKLRNIHGVNRAPGQCTDPVWTNGDVTYNLILEYSPSFTQETSMKFFAQEIKNAFFDYGIYFNIFLLQNSCTDCDKTTSESWGYPWQQPPFKNCLYGRIVENSSFGASGQGSLAGHFWSTEFAPTIIHEVGHALGLLHTFHEFKEDDHEVVQSGNDCMCNCRVKADLICDTPTDPYKSIFEHPETIAKLWNNAMFNESSNIIQNLDNKTDICGTDYGNINNQIKVMDNHMSYHRGLTLFTQGQIDFIKFWNQFQPWVTTLTDETLSFEQGGVINVPSVFNENKIIISDIHLYNDLIINNCEIYFSKDVKIIMYNGSKLILNNSKLSSNPYENCLANPDLWEGIKIMGRADIRMVNGSEINNTKNTCIESVMPQNRLIMSVQSGSKLVNFAKEVLVAKNSFIYLRTNGNSVFNGSLNVENCQGALVLSKTFFPLSNPHKVVNTNISIENECNFGSELWVNNTQIKTLSISNSTFSKLLRIGNSIAPSLFRNNYFTGTQASLRLLNVFDFDIVNNHFDGCSECLRVHPDSENNNSNLIFKNKFTKSLIGININGPSTNLALECNQHSLTINKDWEINQRIASSQGDRDVAAGNIFSRKDPEIVYVPNSNLDYFYRNLNTEEPVHIAGAGEPFFRKNEILQTQTSKCDMPYPPGPIFPQHCSNGVQDENETGRDCGGSCKPCMGQDDQMPNLPVLHCLDGRMNGDETGVDCGGALCPPCNITHCNDGIKNHGEEDVDCGGPCPSCLSKPPSNCFDGIMNGKETKIDCGGDCKPCINYPVFPNADPDLSHFINILNNVYGPDKFVPGKNINIRQDLDAMALLQDNGNTTKLISNIINLSTIDPIEVLNQLQDASPYVSVKAIHTLLSHTQYITSDEFTKVISENPCVLQDPWIAWVVYESGSLTAAEIALIRDSERKGDKCTEKAEIIRIKKHYIHFLIRQKIQTALQSENPDYNFVRSQLFQKEDPSAIYQIYETYIAEGRYNAADNYINKLVSKDETDPALSDQLGSFQKLHAIMMQHYYGGNRVVEMPELYFDQLSVWAEGCFGYTTLVARAVLYDLFKRSFTEQPICTHYLPVKFKSGLKSRTITRATDKFNVKPNPASDKIEVTYITADESPLQGYTLLLKNVSGREIYRTYCNDSTYIINIADLVPGVYFVSVVVSEQVRKTVRFIKLQ